MITIKTKRAYNARPSETSETQSLTSQFLPFCETTDTGIHYLTKESLSCAFGFTDVSVLEELLNRCGFSDLTSFDIVGCTSDNGNDFEVVNCSIDNSTNNNSNNNNNNNNNNLEISNNSSRDGTISPSPSTTPSTSSSQKPETSPANNNTPPLSKSSKEKKITLTSLVFFLENGTIPTCSNSTLPVGVMRKKNAKHLVGGLERGESYGSGSSGSGNRKGNRKGSKSRMRSSKSVPVMKSTFQHEVVGSDRDKLLVEPVVVLFDDQDVNCL